MQRAICRGIFAPAQPDFLAASVRDFLSGAYMSIRAQMMNLLKDIQAQDDVAYLLVAHDLATVRHMADHTVVMYLGKIVEIGDQEAIYAHPTHPYTKALLSAVPLPDPKIERSRKRIMLEGDVPSPVNPPSIGEHLMRKSCDSVLGCIGETPLVRLRRVTDPLLPSVWAKLEFLNPGGSLKDRLAVTLIDEAEKTGIVPIKFCWSDFQCCGVGCKLDPY